MLDGSPIVAIAQIESRNSKVGDSVQTWILRDDISPVEASRTGRDVSICGTCPHAGEHWVDGTRAEGTRTCFVMLFPVQAVWQYYKDGKYIESDPESAAEACAGEVVRLGAYGDPAAVPHGVWTRLLARSAGHNGYTHQWRRFPEFADICMASADSLADRDAAHALGFRTFRVAPSVGWTKEAGEVLCPASAEAGKRTTCDKCRACGGTSAKAHCDIMIPAHGAGKRNVRG